MESIDILVQSLASSGPEYVLTIGIVIILAWLASQGMPLYRDYRMEQLKIQSEREARKAEEARAFDAREKERTEIAMRQVLSEERITLAMETISTQLAVMNQSLEDSKDGSRTMGAKVDDIHIKVGEIHSKVTDNHNDLEELKDQLL